MLGKRLINTGGVGACTTDTVQILDAGSTQSLALYRFEDNVKDTAYSEGSIVSGSKVHLDVGDWDADGTDETSFSGTAWNDKAGSHNFTLTGPPTYSSNNGGYFDFDDGDKASTSTTISNTFANNVTYEMWVNMDESNNYTLLFGKQSASLSGILIGNFAGSAGNIEVYRYQDGSSSSSSATLTGTGLTTGKWQHLVFVMEDICRVYVDGALTATGATFNATYPASFTELNIAAGYNSSYNGNFKMAQFRVYSKSLTAQEVVQNYNATRALYAAYHGTASNVTYATGKFGKAVSFNGTDASIDIESQSLIQSIKSFSFWFKSKFIFGFYDPSSASSSDRRRWFISNTTNGSIKIQVNNDQYNYEQTGITEDSNWHHLAVIDNGKIYLDGNLLSNTFNTSYWITNGTNGTSRDTIRMGSGDYIGSASVSFVQGLMDQMRFFDKTLTAPEINSLYNETATSAASGTIDNPSTIAYYKMADATDETGSYNGTASNVDFNIQGKYGFAGNFDGSSSQIITGYAPQAGTTAATISLWINFNSYANSYAVIAADNNSGATAQGFLTIATGAPGSYGSNGHLWVSLGNQGSGTSAYNINSSVSFDNYGGIGSWIHVAVTVSGTNVSIYMNGTLATSYTSSISYAPTGSAHNYRFGYVSGWGYLDAKLDQIRFFNKAISALEVTKLYNEIQCPNTISNPESYFNTVLFTPTTSTSALPVTGVGFSPGLAWAKYRGTGSGASTQSHYWVDSVRGINSRIFSNSNSAESTTNYVQSFDTDGITYVNNLFNRTGADSVVGWFWKAGSSNVTNNDGTIESTVSASQESGFSIVKYTGTGSAATVGHGLSSAPELILLKNYDSTVKWRAYALGIGATKYLNLNDTDAAGTATTIWNDTTPTSSVFSVGSDSSVSGNNNNIIAYCFANIDGYQRIGSYIGNGSANGPFIYTGFEPAWVIIKNTDTAYRWYMLDNKRCTTNPNNARLFANDSTAEATNSNILNFHTNGFSLITSDAEVNKSGDTMIFMAIAANPDTTAPTKSNSFKTVLYSGNSTSGTGITGVGFKPDLTWIKVRNQGYYHFWHDSVRLVQSDYYLVSSDTNSQGSGAEANQRISSFDDDGFTISGTGNLSNTNASSNDYVSWNWKAADHDRNLPSINNDGESGTIVSVNNEAGFGIVKGYVASSGFTATLGHGFNTKPELIIYKPTSMSAHWYAYSEHGGPLLGINNVLTFSAQGAASSDSLFNITNKTFVAGATATAHSFIAYCWRSISGHSKIGTYTISSASDRVITGLGFTPSWVMVRRTDNSGAWVVTDTSRGITKEIYANLNNQENTDSNGVQSFDTDGFTVGTGSWLGAMNGTYLYMAFK